MEILIGLLATLIRVLPDRYLQFTRHDAAPKKGSLTLTRARLLV